jgi:hypothetical protein
VPPARGKLLLCSLAEGALGKGDASSRVESVDIVCVAEDVDERQGFCGGGAEEFDLVGYDALVLELLLLHHAARASVCSWTSSCVSVCVRVCLCVVCVLVQAVRANTHTHTCVCVRVVWSSTGISGVIHV